MPLYLYQDPKTGKIKEITQSVHDLHEYSENGVKWNRVFTAPEVNTQDKLHAESTSRQFSELTGKQKGSMGDLWDRSQELSDKRKKLYGGQDPVKKKYYKDWSKKRKGKVHPKANSE
jgi:predicted nucleic acid-binding Zn ribbon protein